MNISFFTLERKWVIYVLTYVETVFLPVLPYVFFPYLVNMGAFCETYSIRILLASSERNPTQTGLRKKNVSYNEEIRRSFDLHPTRLATSEEKKCTSFLTVPSGILDLSFTGLAWVFCPALTPSLRLGHVML